MRLGVLGVKNIFVEETTIILSNYFDLKPILLKNNNEKCNINAKCKNDIKYVNKKSIISLLKLPFIIRSTEKDVDGFLVHYLNPYFAFLIGFGLFKKPIAYFSYGEDIRQTGIRGWLVKKALQNINLILVDNIKAQGLFIHDKYKIPFNKIVSNIKLFQTNKSFKKHSCESILSNRKEWNLSKKYIIFSPRTLIKYYNHHLLIEGLNLLDESLKNQLQIVITGVGDQKYIENLLMLAKRYNLDLLNMERKLNPQEMAEIYNISLINVNIPNQDQFGRSIIEGCFCGSIPLLNSEIPNYYEHMEDGKNCIFVDPFPNDIAAKIKYIIDNSDIIKEMFYINNLDVFKKCMKTDENTQELVTVLASIIKK